MEFQEAVEAVEENNHMNDGKWSDWESAEHIADTYALKYDTTSDLGMASRIFIDSMIRTNGENKAIFQQCIDCLRYGYPFSR